MDTAGTITAMADLIAERGLAYRAFEDAQGRVCVVGALLAVATPVDYVVGHPHPVVAAIEAKTGPSIIAWSDTHTQDEAVAMLREVARELRS